MDNLFKGLKVVELASVLAGPAVGRFFAELGAQVVKIENKTTGGDVTRKWKHPKEDPQSNTSAYFHAVNWGKSHLFLNLKIDSDRNKLYELVSEADIVISNSNDIQSQKLGINYAILKEINSRLIYSQLYAFDSEGFRSGYDVVMQAESGFLSMCGTKSGEITKIPVALIDVIAAHQLKEGILIALIKRNATGLGSKVTVSLYEAAVASLMNQATNFLINEQIAQKQGTLHPNIAPYGEVFISKDGIEFVLAIGSDEQFERCWSILKIDSDNYELFKSNQLRLNERQRLFELMQNSIKFLSYAELSNSFLKRNVPFGKIKNVKEVLDDEKSKKLLIKDAKSASISVVTNVFNIT